MKRIIILTVMLVLSTLTLQAQQIGLSSNYLMNKFYYNAAFAGSQDVNVFNAGYRNQWAGFDNAPTNFHFNLHGSIKNQGKFGYGLGLYNQNSGLMNTTGIHLNYAHHFKLSETVKLGLGIQPGFIQYRIRLFDAIMADAGDEVVTGSIYSTNAIDINMGFNLYSNNFFVMGSAQRMLGKSIKFTGYNSQLQFHFNAMAGYNFRFEKQKLELQPSVLVQYTKAIPVQIAGMLRMTYDKKYWLGVMYRNNDALGLNAGFIWKERFTISYGYDFSINGLRKYNSGSHEIMLSIILNKKKPISLEEEDENLNNSILEINEKKKNQKN